MPMRQLDAIVADGDGPRMSGQSAARIQQYQVVTGSALAGSAAHPERAGHVHGAELEITSVLPKLFEALPIAKVLLLLQTTFGPLSTSVPHPLPPLARIVVATETLPLVTNQCANPVPPDNDPPRDDQPLPRNGGRGEVNNRCAGR